MTSAWRPLLTARDDLDVLHHLPPGDPPDSPERGDGPAAARVPLAASTEEVTPQLPVHEPGRGGVRGWLDRVDGLVVPRLQHAAGAVRGWLGRRGAALMRLEERVLGGRAVRFGRQNARLLAPVVGVLLLLGAGIHMRRYPDLASGLAPQQTIDEAGRRSQGPVLAGGQVADVGPAVGEDLDDYIVARQRVLAGLADEDVRVAVISFQELLGARDVEDLLAAVRVHSIQFRNPVAEDRPLSSNVTTGIAAAIEGAVGSARRMAQEERDQVQMLLEDGSVVDPEFIADYERRVEEMDEILAVLDGDPAIVFAVVVEGSVSDLKAVSRHDGVRLVDVAPPETEIAGSGFWGLLPTDRDVASFGHE